MTYYDLNIGNAGLTGEAASLGFKAASRKTVELKSARDVKNIREGDAVESASSELLRKAARRKILVNPLKMKDYHKDDGLVRAVADGNAVFEIPLKPLLDASFAYRAKEICLLRQFLAKCVKLKAGFVVTSRAQSSYDLKSPREVIAIGESLGLTREQADYALSERPKKFLGESR